MIEAIEAQHEAVRAFVETEFKDYRVTRVDCDSRTDYAQPMHGLVENPDYVPVLTQLRFKVRAEYNVAPVRWLECDVYWYGGELHLGRLALEELRMQWRR